MWAIEYHCERCKLRPDHKGRLFKSPDDEDLRRVRDAVKLLEELEDAGDLPIPDAEIPLFTDRLMKPKECRDKIGCIHSGA